MNGTPVMLTLKEAAEALRITERTLYSRRMDGTVRDVRLGGVVLVPLVEIERLTEVSGDGRT